MRAARLNRSAGTFEVEDIQIDRPRGREVLVEIKASGLCHSDLHMAESDFGVPLPALFGHDLAGMVKEIGPDVSEFHVGDHVVGSLIQYCVLCGSCLEGRPYQCEHPVEAQRGADEPLRSSGGWDRKRTRL